MSGNEQRPTQAEIVETGIQLDVYGIKVKLAPGEVDEDKPASWREVGQRINRHLMSLVAGLVGFLDDTVGGARSLVRGIARVPDAVTKRIEKAHQESDTREELAQKRAEAGAVQLVAPDAAQRNLENIINRQKLKGNYANIQDLGGGRWLITVVRPEVGELTTDLAKRSLLESGDRDEG